MNERHISSFKVLGSFIKLRKSFMTCFLRILSKCQKKHYVKFLTTKNGLSNNSVSVRAAAAAAMCAVESVLKPVCEFVNPDV